MSTKGDILFSYEEEGDTKPVPYTHVIGKKLFGIHPSDKKR